MIGVGFDGTAYLYGDAGSAEPFSWTQPNTRTIYFDDDRVCTYKHEWRRVQFELDLEPTPDRLRKAAERQKKRWGYSVRMKK
jgi:hypothetical protein